MEIIGWTNWDNPHFRERLEKVVEELRKHGYRFSGCYHQDGISGVPVFDDGIRFEVSSRMWIKIITYPEDVPLGIRPEYEHIIWAWWEPKPRIALPAIGK